MNLQSFFGDVAAFGVGGGGGRGFVAWAVAVAAIVVLLFVPTLLLSRQEARLQMLADTSPSVVYVTGKPTPWMPKEVPEGGASPGGTAWMSLVVSFAVEGSG